MKQPKGLNQLGKEIHQNAVEKGFYEDENNALYGCHLNNITHKAVKHAFFAQKIALIHTEASEAIEADRDSKHANVKWVENMVNFRENNGSETLFPQLYCNNIKHTVEDELTDILIRVIDLMEHIGMDIEKHVEMKMNYNSLREYKHGKAY